MGGNDAPVQELLKRYLQRAKILVVSMDGADQNHPVFSASEDDQNTKDTAAQAFSAKVVSPNCGIPAPGNTNYRSAYPGSGITVTSSVSADSPNIWEEYSFARASVPVGSNIVSIDGYVDFGSRKIAETFAKRLGAKNLPAISFNSKKITNKLPTESPCYIIKHALERPSLHQLEFWKAISSLEQIPHDYQFTPIYQAAYNIGSGSLRSLAGIGLGIYHTSVCILGREIAFGGHQLAGTGIFLNEEPNFERVKEVQKIIRRLKPIFERYYKKFMYDVTHGLIRATDIGNLIEGEIIDTEGKVATNEVNNNINNGNDNNDNNNASCTDTATEGTAETYKNGTTYNEQLPFVGNNVNGNSKLVKNIVENVPNAANTQAVHVANNQDEGISKIDVDGTETESEQLSESRYSLIKLILKTQANHMKKNERELLEMVLQEPLKTQIKLVGSSVLNEFVKKRLIGYTSLSPIAIATIVKALASKWKGQLYHLLTFNCNTFTDELIRTLTGEKARLPKQYNNIASLGICCVAKCKCCCCVKSFTKDLEVDQDQFAEGFEDY